MELLAAAWWQTALAVAGELGVFLIGGWLGFLLGRGRRAGAPEESLE